MDIKVLDNNSMERDWRKFTRNGNQEEKDNQDASIGVELNMESWEKCKHLRLHIEEPPLINVRILTIN